MKSVVRKACQTLANELRSGNRVGRSFYEILRHLGVFDAYHALQDMADSRNSTDEQRHFAKVMDDLSDKVDMVEQMLADDMSKRVYRSVIEYRKTKDRKYLTGRVVSKHQYFQGDIFRTTPHERFVDGGSYDGADILRFAKFAGQYEAIYAFEPMTEMIGDIEKKVKRHGLKNVHIYPVGLWKEKASLCFNFDGNASDISTDGNGDTVPVDSLDHLFPDTDITWIKMDIEGSEIEALHGAAALIKRATPKLSICIYHKPEDLVEIPLLINELVPEYKLYIRHHTHRGLETVLYATVD